MEYLCVEIDNVLHFTYAADLRDYHLILEALGERFEGDNNQPHSLTDIMNDSEFEHYQGLLRLASMTWEPPYQDTEDDMSMFSVFVEVEPSPLAETTCVGEKQVVDWLKDKFELYKGVPGEIIFKISKLEDRGIDPDTAS